MTVDKILGLAFAALTVLYLTCAENISPLVTINLAPEAEQCLVAALNNTHQQDFVGQIPAWSYFTDNFQKAVINFGSLDNYGKVFRFYDVASIETDLSVDDERISLKQATREYRS